jgi:hypothetical protein
VKREETIMAVKVLRIWRYAYRLSDSKSERIKGVRSSWKDAVPAASFVGIYVTVK